MLYIPSLIIWVTLISTIYFAIKKNRTWIYCLVSGLVLFIISLIFIYNTDSSSISQTNSTNTSETLAFYPLVSIIVIGGIIYGLSKIKFKTRNDELICTACGYVGTPKKLMKGSIAVEFLLWLLLIIPGLIYTTWRSSSQYKACPKCKGTSMIPTDTPVGQKLLNEFRNS